MSRRSPGRPPHTSHSELRDLARGLFLEQGYDQTSLADIARAAGVSRTTLFAYFSSKRDLLWEEFDQRAEHLDAHLADAASGDLIDTLVDAILVLAAFTREEHDGFAQRARIVHGSAELRAYTALRTRELADQLIAFATLRAPNIAPETLGDITHALMAVASRAIEDWASLPAPERHLHEHVRERLTPFAAALRPLV